MKYLVLNKRIKKASLETSWILINNLVEFINLTIILTIEIV